MEEEGDDDTNCVWYTLDSSQKISTRTEKIENKMTSRNNSDQSIIEIHKNSKKSPGELRRLFVTQTPVRNYQLTLV